MEDEKDHGGADAVVKAQIATLAHRFWTIHPRELQDKGMTREDFYIREMTALVAAVAANASVEARLREALRDLVALVSTDSRYDDSESLRSARNILFAENKAAMTARRIGVLSPHTPTPAIGTSRINNAS